MDLNNLGAQNTGNFDINNLNVVSSDNNVDNQKYNLVIDSNNNNYNNDLNSLVMQNTNSTPDVNYSIGANPMFSNLTFGVQNEDNKYENLQSFENNNENSSYVKPGQSVTYNYSYSVPINNNSAQY